MTFLSNDCKCLASIKADLKPHLFVLSEKRLRFQPAGGSKESLRISLSLWFLHWEEQLRMVNSMPLNIKPQKYLDFLILTVDHMKYYFIK